MRVIVCGGRDYLDYSSLSAALTDVVYASPTPVTIIAGEAIGADFLAKVFAHTKWAISKGTKYEGYPANWKKHNKAAGPVRNQEMLDTGVDLVLAFPGGAGTANMIKKANKAEVTVSIQV